jgi:hypothetical protein
MSTNANTCVLKSTHVSAGVILQTRRDPRSNTIDAGELYKML